MRHRKYHLGCELDIATEVITNGKSERWTLVNNSDSLYIEVLEQAQLTEQTLRKYNIGYVDDMFGGWGYKEGGSDFFSQECFTDKVKKGLKF